MLSEKPYAADVMLQSEHLQFRRSFRRFVEQRLAPLAAKGEKEKRFPLEVYSALREGGYLSREGDARLLDTPRTRLVLLLIRVLCGPGGPRAVAEMTRRKAGDGDGRIPAALARR